MEKGSREMARKPKYKPGRFEATGEKGETFTSIYSGMLRSVAYMSLTKNQRLLYIYMKMQRYGKRKPAQVYKNIPQMQDDRLIFFSMGDSVKMGLYTRNNSSSFWNDIKALIEHGLISREASGKNQYAKTVYRLSDKWQDWKPES